MKATCSICSVCWMSRRAVAPVDMPAPDNVKHNVNSTATAATYPKEQPTDVNLCLCGCAYVDQLPKIPQDSSDLSHTGLVTFVTRPEPSS